MKKKNNPFLIDVYSSDIKIEKIYDKIGIYRYFMDLGFVGKIFIRIGEFLEKIVLLFRGKNLEKKLPIFTGVKIGYDKATLCIKSGGLVSVLGDFIYNLETKQLSMKNSIVIYKNRSKDSFLILENALKYLEKKSLLKAIMFGMSLGALLVISILFFQSCRDKIK